MYGEAVSFSLTIFRFLTCFIGHFGAHFFIHKWVCIFGLFQMGEAKENDVYEEELLDYEDEDERAPNSVAAKGSVETVKKYVF